MLTTNFLFRFKNKCNVYVIQRESRSYSLGKQCKVHRNLSPNNIIHNMRRQIYILAK